MQNENLLLILGNQCVPFNEIDTLKVVKDFCKEDSDIWAMMNAFNYGAMQGIRREKAKHRGESV